MQKHKQMFKFKMLSYGRFVQSKNTDEHNETKKKNRNIFLETDPICQSKEFSLTNKYSPQRQTRKHFKRNFYQMSQFVSHSNAL